MSVWSIQIGANEPNCCLADARLALAGDARRLSPLVHSLLYVIDHAAAEMS